MVAAIAAARTRLGAPYVWGATGPTTLRLLRAHPVGVRRGRGDRCRGPRASSGTSARTRPSDELLPGDLLFWATNTADPATIHHVALYIGDGYMIEAPHTGAVVHVAPVYLDGYIGATRPVLPGGRVPARHGPQPP